jgi:hypothetical protein
MGIGGEQDLESGHTGFGGRDATRHLGGELGGQLLFPLGLTATPLILALPVDHLLSPRKRVSITLRHRRYTGPMLDDPETELFDIGDRHTQILDTHGTFNEFRFRASTVAAHR